MSCLLLASMLIMSRYFVCIYRTSVLREIEMEDKRRKWYFDQLEDLQKKLESLPVSDTVSF